MEITFKNTYANNYISEIHFSIDHLPKDEWNPYSLQVMSPDGKVLFGIEQTLSQSCLKTFMNKLAQVVDNQNSGIAFEPIEPSFTLTFSKLNDTLVKVLLVIDMEFVRNGKATQTGIGALIHVNREDFRKNLEKIKGEIE